MNTVKYEDINEVDFVNNELLTSFEHPSTSAGAVGLPEPKLNLLDGTFFTYMPEKSTVNKIVAICMVCRPRHVEVKGYGNCSSNFLSHLKRRHGDETVADYKNYIRCKKSRTAKYSMDNESAKPSASPSGRVTEPTTMTLANAIGKEALNQTADFTEQFDENVLQFFISTMIPTNVVENPSFLQLLDLHSSVRNLQLLTQQNLEKRIKDTFASYVADIKYKLSGLDNVCTAVHIWSGEKKHFIGVTVHWITQDMCRSSAPIACRTIKCKHYNQYRLSQLIREINEDFGISSSKLVGTISGSGSDFLRDFKTFGVHLTNILMSEELDLEDCILFEPDDCDFCDESEQENSIANVIQIDTNTACLHLKCCSKTLISAITNAIHEELNYANNTVLSNIHATTINKCNILWKAAGNPKLAEIIEIHANTKLKRPNFSDWTSLNKALHQILRIEDKSAVLHKALNLQNPISDAEFRYLQEYLICTAPIVEALDILQSNQNTFYGIVMPCIYALRRNLNKTAEKTQLYYCTRLINSYSIHVTTAFSKYFDLNTEIAQNAAFAALSFPRFKNQWLVCVSPTERNEILNAFKQVVSKEINTKLFFDAPVPEKNSRENDFFNFDADFDNETTKNNVQRSIDAPFRKAEAQVLQFFAEESTDLAILYGYPEIKRVFLKYNTPLPSLATGEQLFHLSTMDELKRNQTVFNELLEKRIILNANLNRNQF